MNNDNGKEQADVLHHASGLINLDEERAHSLPAVSDSSRAAEIVKQIIEQILVNERRRARVEFIQISVFFLVLLSVVLGAGIWFARQLLFQLREERQFTEQTWRMIAGGGYGPLRAFSTEKKVGPPGQTDIKTPPALDGEEVARLERSISALSQLLETEPQNVPDGVRDMLQSQQKAIQALSARLNEARINIDEAPQETVDFIAAPLEADLHLRMPIPSYD